MTEDDNRRAAFQGAASLRTPPSPPRASPAGPTAATSRLEWVTIGAAVVLLLVLCANWVLNA